LNDDNPIPNTEVIEANGNGGKAFAPRISEEKDGNEPKPQWWPNCTHPRYTKLAVRKFRDRIVILWKCRRCPKEVREVIDIDMNAREVFTKSTKSALPRRFDADPAA
jgi:hypothetical protein